MRSVSLLRLREWVYGGELLPQQQHLPALHIRPDQLSTSVEPAGDPLLHQQDATQSE